MAYRFNNVPALQGGAAAGQGVDRPRSPFDIVTSMRKHQIANQTVMRMLQYGVLTAADMNSASTGAKGGPSSPKKAMLVVPGCTFDQWTAPRMGLTKAAKQWAASSRAETGARGGPGPSSVNMGAKAGPSSATTGAMGGQSGDVEAKAPKRKYLTESESVCERRDLLGEEEDYILGALPKAYGRARKNLLARLSSIEIEDDNLAEYQATGGPISKSKFLRAARARRLRAMYERVQYKAPAATTTTVTTTTTVSTVQDNTLPESIIGQPYSPNTIGHPYSPIRFNTPLPPVWVKEVEEEQDLLYTPGEAAYA